MEMLNKKVFDIHGTSLSEETIVAIRMVKDFIQHCGGTNNVSITKDMVKSCQFAHSHYVLYLDEKKKEEETPQQQLQKEAEKKEAAEEARVAEEKNMEKKNELLGGIEMFQNYIQIAEKTIVNGNEEMGKLLKSNVLVQKDCQLVQGKIDMGIKRKATYQTELEELKKKLSKLL